MFSKIRTVLNFIIKSIFIVVFILMIVILTAKKSDVLFCEGWSRTVARNYGEFMGKINSIIPFSISEVTMVLLISLMVFWLVLAIIQLFKLKFIKSISKVFNIALVLLAIFASYTFSCEMAYNRMDMPITLKENASKEDYLNIVNHFIDDVNDCTEKLNFSDDFDVISPYSFDDLCVLVSNEYQRLTDDYFTSYTTKPKQMFLSFLYTEFQITGFTFMPFGEANVNIHNTTCDIPFTIAHELAHSKGVMKEEDANFLATYLLLSSDNYYLRYSAYQRSFSQILSIAGYTENKSDLENCRNRVHPNFRKNSNFNYQYWQNHNALEHIGDFFNDIYLKISGESNGTESYSGGTTYHYDETTKVLTPSRYQKLYFTIYYSELQF